MANPDEATSEAPDELVHLSVEQHVAAVTLDSPANRNALSRRLVDELRARLTAADADERVRVIVLTHTGGTFCSGADLAEAATDGMERGTRALLDLLSSVLALATPVIAVVRGHVRAGGVGLIGACDLVLATDTSTFAFTEARLGLAPAIISLTTRPLLPARAASRLYLTGEVFDGSAAQAFGLVTESHPAEFLDDALATLLADFAAVSPQGLRETKALLTGPVRSAIEHDGDALVDLSARLFASEEAREGMAAFRERRPPRWRSSN